jgi:hypothetical protein
MPRLLRFAAVVCIGCTSKPEPPPAARAITTPYSEYAVRNDSTLRLVLALEDSIRRDSTGGETPRRLYQLGHLVTKNYLDLTRGMPDTAFKIGRDSMYFYNEIGGGYLYNGFHFRELARRFPADTFAAIAAFDAAFLPEGGECEGYVACYMSRHFEPIATFLRSHARSRFAEQAIDSINIGFRRSLTFADSVKATEPSWVDTTDIRNVLSSYDSLAAMLPGPLRTRAYESLAPWLARFRLKPRGPTDS